MNGTSHRQSESQTTWLNANTFLWAWLLSCTNVSMQILCGQYTNVWKLWKTKTLFWDLLRHLSNYFDTLCFKFPWTKKLVILFESLCFRIGITWVSSWPDRLKRQYMKYRKNLSKYKIDRKIYFIRYFIENVFLEYCFNLGFDPRNHIFTITRSTRRSALGIFHVH